MRAAMKEWAKSMIRDLYCLMQYQNQKPDKVLFDHLPKCGGTTVEHYLRSHYLTKKTYMIDSQNPQYSMQVFKSLPEAKRYDYDFVYGHLADGLLDFVHPDTISLTIFRDPVDRIVSHYYYVKRKPNHYLHDMVTSKNLTLEEYAASGISVELRNWYVAHFLGIPIGEAENRPEWSVTEALRIIKERYHIVGFLDDLETAMDSLGKKAGYRKRFQNSYRNKSAGRPRMSDIDLSVLDTIKQVNFLDVELYSRLKNRA